MSLADYAGITAFVIGVVSAVWNIMNGRIRSKSLNALESGQYLESVNKSIALANQRALDAEERAIKSENVAKKYREEGEAVEKILEERLSILEKGSSYRLIFDVTLGAEPRIEHSEIVRFQDIRIERLDNKQ